MNDYKKEDIFVIVFIVAFIISVVFMCTSRNNLHDNGNSADAIRNELEHAQEAQCDEATAIRETKQSISRSKAAVTNSEERIGASEQTNREIADAERADAEIIAESQSILARVRERGGAEN